MLVTVANGARTTSIGVCKQLQWHMQGHDFVGDLRLLPLGGCDIVLGADWLSTLGDVTFNLSKLSISFLHHDNLIKLQSSTSKPSLLLMSGNAMKKFIKKNTCLGWQIFSHRFNPNTRSNTHSSSTPS